MNYHFGLIGYPISFSLSPFIHQQFFNKTGTTGEYSIIDIHPQSDFAEAMESLRAMNLDGFNVTVPYKQKIMSFLDKVDESATNIGAVNTVINREGEWIGYNTDGMGYVRSLEIAYPFIENKKNEKILILGAGGAAKGIYHGLKSNGYKQIFVANRTIDKALDITKEDRFVLTLESAADSLQSYSLIIQTTSVGMKPNNHQTIISLDQLKEDAIASDIVYQPMETKFLKEAESCGAHLLYGHKMLLYQAQFAFEIWTGIKPDVEGMDEALISILEG